MSEAKKFQRWAGTAFSIQFLTLLIADVLLTRKVVAISRSLHDSLYAGSIATEQLNQVDQTLLSILTGGHWLMLLGMSLSIVTFGGLILMTKESLRKQSGTDSPDRLRPSAVDFTNNTGLN
jgi:hypothetical protein